MASKSAKRARVDASSSKDSSAAISPPLMAAGGADRRNDAGVDEDVVSRLRRELETATKCIEQLRREKDYEVRQAREEEQNRSSTAMKELESRLKADCRREVERTRETVKSRLEADTARLAGRYERTVKRLSNDLDRCRNELREEVEKRGMSSTTRGGFETERCRLLTEVRDLKAAKRRLEESVESYAEVDKQKTAELKRTQEACKAEVAKLSKEANAEIRKLLEELKAKDHQLALLDRNQYPDRGASLPKQHQSNEGQPKEPDSAAASRPVKPATAGEANDGSAYQINAEIISDLKKEVEKLKNQLAASEADRTAMTVRLDELNRELTQRNETIANLQKVDRCTQEAKPSALKTSPKAVRFLLPGATSPVLAREVEPVLNGDDDNDSITSDLSGSSMSSSSSVLSQDTTVLYDESIVKNYHILLSEHLSLQRSLSLLLSSWTSTSASSAKFSKPSSSSSTSSMKCSISVKSIDEITSTCNRQDCIVEKESMKVAMEALENQHAQFEQNVYQLQQQLKEEREVNEDLEFRVFELEDSVEKCKLAHSSNAAEDLLEKTRLLEEEMSVLKERLTYYNKIESEVIQPAGLGLREYVEIVKRQLGDAESQSAMSRLEVMALRKQLEEAVKCQVEVSTGRSKAHLGMTRLDADERDLMIDIDDLSIGAMNSSMSTTSGFDDDENSYASSVADLRLDEMPSEETWGFDDDACVNVDAEPMGEHRVNACDRTMAMSNVLGDRSGKERKFSAKSDPARRLQQINGEEVSAEAVRVSDEELWLSRFEKLEARLAQAIQNEQRARDQAALLGEEKDRRIAALQEQVDQLEANEFRLSETIKSLERLERTFNQHMKNSKDRNSSTSSSQSTSSISTDCRETGHDVGSPTESEDAFFREDVVDHTAELAMRDICAAVASENRVQHETSAMLKSSLEHLRLTEAESDAIDKRIKDLSGGVNGMATIDGTSIVESGSGWNVPAAIVDFEAEYRELEVLIRELKGVLIVENDSGKRRLSIDVDGRNVTSDDVASTLEVETSNNWETGSACYSTPASPMFEMQMPNGLMMERSREFEQIERCLTQQIRSLEQERDILRDAVSEGEATMRELGIQLVELQSSERSLKDEVGRLKAKEEWMISRNDELMELVGRLEDSVKSHRASEIDLRSRAERHCASETELGRELDDARDELRAVEARYRRWVSQLDDEKMQLQAVVDELMEKNSDLEGREAGLLCRIRKLEATEFGLRSEVADLERTLAEATEDREKLLNQVSCKEQDETAVTAVSTVDGWTQCDNDEGVSGYEERCRHLAERADFFKEMLEFTELAYAGLESKLAERVAAEEALQASVAEHQEVEKTLLERSTSLEADAEKMMKKITELEATIEDMKIRYSQPSDLLLQTYGKQSRLDEDGFYKDSDVAQVKQQAASAFQDIMLLSEVADALDDNEMILWATVENARIGGDAVTETDLTSSFWSNVEARMGLNSDSPSQLDDYQETHLSLTSSHQQPISQPPPLPLSPPPSSPAADVGTENFLFDRQRANGETKDTIKRLAPQQRSHSLDPFSSRTPAPSDEHRWERANSESRDSEVVPKMSAFSKEQLKTNHTTEQPEQNSSSAPTDGAAAAAKDPIMERITRSREFWSARSLSTPGQQPPTPGPSANHPSSSNGRPSLIPRIALPVRTPPLQRSVSEYGGPKAGWIPTAPTAMPVIRSAPSPHLSPKLSSTEGDDKKNKSYIPRPINECRTSGSDSESSEHSTSSKQKVTHGRPGHRESSKIYTTVMGPNRYVTSKFSHLSSSSLNPHAARASAVDSKTNPASASSSFATATTQLTQRPVVSSTASGSEVPQLPSSRA